MKNKLNIILLLSLFAGTSIFAQEQERPVLHLTLEQCKEMGLENDHNIVNANLDVFAAQAQKQEALAEYFPKLSFNTFGFYAIDPILEIGVTDIFGHSDFSHNLQNLVNQLAPQLGINPTYSTLQRGFNSSFMLTQPVFAGGMIVTGNKMAALGVEAASLQQKVQVRKTSEEIEQDYWQIISLEEKESTLDDVRNLLDTLYKDVLNACDAGVATRSDLLKVELKKNEVKSGKIRLRNGIRLSKMKLFNSIGVEYNPYTTFHLDSIPFLDDIILSDGLSEMESPDEYYQDEQEIAANQEEARLLDISVEVKRLEKRMAVGETLPHIAVGANYGYGSLIDKGSFNGGVFAMVQIPITDWGKNSRKIKRLDYQMQKAENDREYLDKMLVLQSHKMWMDLTAAWEQLLVAEESVRTAEAVLNQMRDHFKAGMTTIAEVLQVETQYTQAKEEMVDQSIAYRIALSQYLDRSKQ